MGRVLIVPGLHGSGPAHWQSWLAAQLPGARRIEQADNSLADLPVWAGVVGAALEEEAAPVWLVAHSFGCLASSLAAARHADKVAGLLLVAPASPAKFGVQADLPGRLRARSLLVASRNDPWMGFADAQALATQLGSAVHDAGAVGHLNTEAGFGPWPAGLALLARLQAAGMAAGAPASLQ